MGKKRPFFLLARIPGTPKRGPSAADHYTCKSKRRYSTKEDAEVKGSRVYRCPVCKFFHRATLK